MAEALTAEVLDRIRTDCLADDLDIDLEVRAQPLSRKRNTVAVRSLQLCLRAGYAALERGRSDAFL